MTVDRDGRETEQTKTVTISAGGRSSVSFADLSLADAMAMLDAGAITLKVPAEAKVWLAGNATTSVGEMRQFETTGLPAGQTWKNYEIRVVTVVDGREQVATKVIDLAAGQSLELAIDPAQRTASSETTASVR